MKRVHLHLRRATGELRTAQFEDREHLVVPVVALVEGVIFPMGASFPEFVAAEVFGDTPQSWNGRPVVLGHPSDAEGLRATANEPQTLERIAIGCLFNTRVEHKRLLTEAWIDSARVEAIGDRAQRMVERLKGGEQVEVSVGVFAEVVPATGAYQGKPYRAAWKSIMSDHLALLEEGETGACSVKMGCGAPRAAQAHDVTKNGITMPERAGRKEGRMARKSLRQRFAALKEMLTKQAEDEALTVEELRDADARIFATYRVAAEDMSDADLRDALDRALRSTEPAYLGIDAVFPDATEVVYAVAPEDVLKQFRRSYTLDASGEVALGGEAVEVRPVTRFEPVAAKQGTGTAQGGSDDPVGDDGGEEEGPMVCTKERVNALIAGGRFAEEDRTWLEKVPEGRFAALEAVPKATPPEPQPQPEPKELTEEEWLAKAPATLRQIITDHQARAAQQRTDLVTQLKDAPNVKGVYTEDELKAMPVEALDKLARVAKASVPVDQSGRGLPRAASEGEDEGPDAPPSLRDAVIARRK